MLRAVPLCVSRACKGSLHVCMCCTIELPDDTLLYYLLAFELSHVNDSLELLWLALLSDKIQTILLVAQ